MSAACLYPSCPGPLYARDLCRVHYLAARRAVLAGVTTWPALVEAGKAGPGTRPRGRKAEGEQLEVCLGAANCLCKVYLRGLCQQHYKAARELVKGGHYSWAVLIEQGLALPGKQDAEREWFRTTGGQHDSHTGD